MPIFENTDGPALKNSRLKTKLKTLDVLKAIMKNTTVLWRVTPCRLVAYLQRLQGTGFLYKMDYPEYGGVPPKQIAWRRIPEKAICDTDDMYEIQTSCAGKNL